MLDAGIACENYSHILRSVIDITEMGRIYTSANIAIQRCLYNCVNISRQIKRIFAG